MRALLERSLECAVAVVGSKHGAEQLFGTFGKRGRPDIVLCDRELIDGQGEVVIAKMQTYPAMRGVPVIAVSGTVEPDLERRMTRAGAVAVLSKADVHTRLVDLVRQHAA